jgi:hypothetical protein
MNTLGHSLKIESFKFGDIFDRKFVSTNQLFSQNLVLVETADDTDTLAEMSPFWIGEYSVEESGGETNNV